MPTPIQPRPFGAVRAGHWLLVMILTFQFSGLTWVGLFGLSKALETGRAARRGGLRAALERIPQGKGSCGMCQKIRHAQSEQTQQQRLRGSATVDLPFLVPAVLDESVATIRPSCESYWPTAGLRHWRVRLDTPPVPPPRA